MINAKKLREKYFPEKRVDLKSVMDNIEKEIISAAEKHDESVVVKVPIGLKQKIKGLLEDENYTVCSSAVGRPTESLDKDTQAYLSIFWPEDLVNNYD
jgi:hypothetical protein